MFHKILSLTAILLLYYYIFGSSFLNLITHLILYVFYIIMHNSTRPSCQPSSLPSTQPSDFPTVTPTLQPNSRPSCHTLWISTWWPSRQPTGRPTFEPSRQPSSLPNYFDLIPPANSQPHNLQQNLRYFSPFNQLWLLLINPIQKHFNLKLIMVALLPAMIVFFVWIRNWCLNVLLI